MTEPTSGTVRFHERPLPSYDVLALRRRVGLVQQRAVLFAGTVAENLRTGARELTDDDVAALLDRVGLSPQLAPRDAAELSGGEAQRVCLARALAVGPEVLLLDEPTSSLDRFAAAAVEGVVRGLADDGLTVVWISHDLRQARRHGDDALVVFGGRVVESGAAETVFGAPRDASAAAFLGGAT
ncbi:MAG: UDP-glucose/iron transport system ATP-binding protein [Solirubrobacteraceae bacterium]|jgi:putative ABC transport system ATP-binding protein|nr:UDP-glucose/iron transport system ATP-binding protein [Solirubrobacteraceae bacterium]